MLDEVIISKAIVDTYGKKLSNILDVDAAICGGGPAGLVCAQTLAKSGKKAVLFEKKLSLGGGMWGGGIMFNEIVVQSRAKKILDEYGIKSKKYRDNYYLADSVECVCALGYHAARSGAIIMNGIYAEDIMIRKNRVCGLVINWAAVQAANLHVDPITIRAKFVVDATGHPAEVAGVVARKSDIKLRTKTGKIMGERPMWADVAESTVEKNSKEICPGLYVCGMCANAVFGAPRMGPIFGGMLLSGKKVALSILKRL